ncbi:DUF4407 domain-containing protein [Actinokineospora sp. G85]|uniref:DUF4407 domain-containing protein n=1 Tax=Actinokineospora sp. G85 TaxID=3406626 RepID=UPI003C721603
MSPRRLLAILAGARPEILAKAAGDTTKHAVMGGVLLSTAGLAGVAAFFALSSTLGMPVWPAVACALVWFVVILNLDRMLVVTLNSVSGKRAIAVVAPRLLMAAVIGTVVATPLTLQVFNKEITAELQTMRAEAVVQMRAKLDDAHEQIGSLERQEKSLQDAIAGRNVTAISTDPDVVAAQGEYDRAQTAYQAAEREAQCELNGTCGTGRRGVGEAYDAARAAADQARAARDDAKRKLDGATEVARARIEQGREAGAEEAKQKIKSVQADLATAQERKRQAESDALDAERGNTGLLARLSALDRITEGNSTASAAKWVLAALFFLIEVLPVLSKLLTMFGKPTLYDRLLERHDNDLDHKDVLASTARRQTEKNNADAAVLLAKQKTDAQVKAGQDAMDELVERQGQIAIEAIRTWAEVAKLRADEQLDDWYRRHVGPHTSRPWTGSGNPPAPAFAPPAPPHVTTMPPPPQHDTEMTVPLPVLPSNGWGAPVTGSGNRPTT